LWGESYCKFVDVTKNIGLYFCVNLGGIEQTGSTQGRVISTLEGYNLQLLPIVDKLTNIFVENYIGHSCSGRKWLAAILKDINPKTGVLPDFLLISVLIRQTRDHE
jgi:hypothetical protein